jgi:hypothetical protein
MACKKPKLCKSVLHPFQIVCRFGFSRYMDFDMYPDMMYSCISKYVAKDHVSKKSHNDLQSEMD